MFKHVGYIVICLALLAPGVASAQTQTGDEIFEARVVEITGERTLERESGTPRKQQNLKLEALTGSLQGETFSVEGISDIEALTASAYDIGDRVMVARSVNNEGESSFYITDYIRRGTLYVLAALFAVLVVVIGRWKGLRALVSLILSFVIIVYAILPLLLNGYNPLLVGIIGSLLILTVLIYLTEGLNAKSHLAIASIGMTLLVVGALALIVTAAAHLSGYAQDEILYLISAGQNMLDFRGLLLAGILIGTIGAMDDVVISQIEAVAQLKRANPDLTARQLTAMANEIGRAHMGAMMNTLFLAYTSASLPLLLLFSLRQPPFLSFGQIINHEIIATEIIRTIIGSTGIVLAIPIATYLAVRFLELKPNTALDDHGHTH